MLSERYLLMHVLPAAMGLLPENMNAKEAWVMLLAIGWQESRFTHREQIGGPARGFWQFERGGGVAGVLSHRASAKHAASVCAALRYPVSTSVVYEVMADNDVLACAFARLLLWTHPHALPGTNDELGAWAYYEALWRPGKPHPETWPEAHAWARKMALG